VSYELSALSDENGLTTEIAENAECFKIKEFTAEIAKNAECFEGDD
jgi:hypothetical protein